MEPLQAQPIASPSTPMCPTCQKVMVDSVIADLGHRYECAACKAIALRKGDMATLALTTVDLPDAPWASANQSILPCPHCPTSQLKEVVYSQAYPEPLFFCQSCTGILISHESLGRIRRFRLKLEIKDDFNDWMDPHEGILSLLAFPICIILAWLSDILVLPAMLLHGIDIQFHEFGHTFFSWIAGTPAVPLAIVTLPIKIPKAFTFLTLGYFFFFWSRMGRKEHLRAFTGFFYGLIAFQVFMTFFISETTAAEYFVLGGALGQFLFPLVLGMAYFYDLPKFWNWTYLRYGFLFVALYCLEHNSEYWGNIVKGKLPFPWGSVVGGASDTNGDMNRLIGEMGWTEVSLGRMLNMLGLLCRTTIWSHFLYQLVQKIKSSSSPKK